MGSLASTSYSCILGPLKSLYFQPILIEDSFENEALGKRKKSINKLDFTTEGPYNEYMVVIVRQTLNRLNKKFNQDGFTLTEVVVGLGLFAVVSLIGFQMLSMYSSFERDINTKTGLVEIKNRLNYYLNQERSLINMINNNASMGCIKDNTSCAGQGGVVDVFNNDPGAPAPVLGFQPSVATEGLTATGTICNTFPSANCGLKYNIVWAPRCGTDAIRCLGYSINYVILANLVRDAAYVGPVLDIDSFRISIARNSAGEMAQEICTTFNGTFNAGNRTCSMGITEQCPPGQFFVGLNADNSKLCVGIPNIKCPLGSVVYRIDADGNMYCRSGCYILPGFQCTANMWTGAGNCPGNVQWSPGNGIVAIGPTPGFNLSPDAVAPPPPPPPPPPF